jgi:hypothetical protein
MTSVVFLPANTQLRSKKDQEVIASFARSHAARVGRPHTAKKPPKTRDVKRISQVTNAVANRRAQPGPWLSGSLIQHGNSDPFESFALSITPRFTELLTFYSSTFLPVTYSSYIVPSTSTNAIVKFRNVESADDFRSTLAVLRDRTSAVGFFLAQLTILSRIAPSPELRVERLRLRSEALGALKAGIQDNVLTGDAITESVLNLLYAAVFDGDLAEARMHLIFLRDRLVERVSHQERPRPLGIVLLFRVLYMDLAVGVTYLAPTVFDVEHWVPQVLTSALQQAQASQSFRPPPIAGFLANIDRGLCEPLLNAVFECRRLLWVWWTQLATVGNETTLTIETHPQTYTFRWMYSQLYVNSLRLSNLLVSLQDAYLEDALRTSTDPAAPKQERLFGRYLQRIVALSLLTLLSASCTKVLIAGQPLRPGSDFLLGRLRDDIEPALDFLRHTNFLASSHEQDLSRALLWACCVGTAVEGLKPPPSPVSSPGSGTSSATVTNQFADDLVFVARLLELSSKSAVVHVLQRFVYNDYLLSDHTIWERIAAPEV